MADPGDPYAQIAKPIANGDPYAALAKPIETIAQPAMPGALDYEIPLTSHAMATASGLQSVGRGLRGAVVGIGHALSPVPQEDKPPIAGPGGQQIYRFGKGLYDLGRQALQVPAAIHDINQSPDPLGTFANAGKEAAGQGAAQALLMAGTEGVTRLPLVKIARTGLETAKGAGRIADTATFNRLSSALDTIRKTGGNIHDIWHPPIYPGAPFPEAPAVFPGAHLPENPGEFPGAPFPEAPAVFPGAHLPENPGEFPGAPFPARPGPALLQSRGLATGARIPEPEPASALERIGPPSSASMKTSSPGKLGDLLNEGLGGRPLTPNVPLRLQIGEPDRFAGVTEGFTPVKSSALKGYRYNPQTQELDVVTTSNTAPYRFAGVTPEHMAAFEGAQSKGAAWNIIRNAPGVEGVGKLNAAGELVPRIKPRTMQSATPEDLPAVPAENENLVPALKKSVAKAKAAKTVSAKVAQP